MSLRHSTAVPGTGGRKRAFPTVRIGPPSSSASSLNGSEWSQNRSDKYSQKGSGSLFGMDDPGSASTGLLSFNLTPMGTDGELSRAMAILDRNRYVYIYIYSLVSCFISN